MNFTEEKGRIVCYGEQGEVLAEITFPSMNRKTVNINHTFVDESLRGMGVAGQLMDAVVSYLEKNNKKALPTCSYAVGWFAKHPEYARLLVTSGKEGE